MRSSGAAVSMEIVMIGDGLQVREMLDHLDSAFSVMGMGAFMDERIVPYLRTRAQGRFGAEGDGASGKWAPLKPATVKVREQGAATGIFAGISGSHPINVRTHDLEQYITQGRGEVTFEGNGNVSLHYPRRSAPAGELGKKVRRAQVGDGNAVPRPVLAINETDLTAVMSHLAYFIQGLGNVGNSV